MLETVAEHEVKQLSSCFSNFEQYRNQPPGLTVVVVHKRINTRLFAVNRQVSVYIYLPKARFTLHVLL